jgi:hypothetical protein
LKARIRAKVEHPFRVIKRQFGVCEGALPWADEEHGATAHTVRALQSLAGATPTFAEYAGISAPAARPRASMGSRKADKSTSVALKSIKTGASVSCREIRAVTGLRCAGFEHHP